MRQGKKINLVAILLLILFLCLCEIYLVSEFIVCEFCGQMLATEAIKT